MTKIISRSFDEAEALLTDDPGWAVVSVGAPETAPPRGFDREREEHVRFEFRDLTINARQSPQWSDVDRLLECADTLLDHDRLLIHCWAGVSRSTAIAYTLWVYQDIEPVEAIRRIVEDRPKAHPNRKIVRMAAERLRTGPQMERALDQIERIKMEVLVGQD